MSPIECLLDVHNPKTSVKVLRFGANCFIADGSARALDQPILGDSQGFTGQGSLRMNFLTSWLAITIMSKFL